MIRAIHDLLPSARRCPRSADAPTTANARWSLPRTTARLLCAAYSGTASTACTVRAFDSGDSRGAWVNAAFTSGDRDFGAFEGECDLDEYVAGVSINPSTRRPHSLLCCAR